MFICESNHHIRSRLQSFNLRAPCAGIITSIHRHTGERHIKTESLHLLINLLGQFTSRSHNQRIQLIRIMIVIGQIGQ